MRAGTTVVEWNDHVCELKARNFVLSVIELDSDDPTPPSPPKGGNPLPRPPPETSKLELLVLQT